MTKVSDEDREIQWATIDPAIWFLLLSAVMCQISNWKVHNIMSIIMNYFYNAKLSTHEQKTRKVFYESPFSISTPHLGSKFEVSTLPTKLATSNNSINCWSITLSLGVAYIRYSAKTGVKAHPCNFLKIPITHPVRCFPALQCTKIGWFRRSRIVTRAPMILVSGITTNGSLFPGMGNWKNWIPADARKARFSAG